MDHPVIVHGLLEPAHGLPTRHPIEESSISALATQPSPVSRASVNAAIASFVPNPRR